LAAVCVVAGAVLLVLLDSGWAHVVGVLCLFGCAASVFVLATTSSTEETYLEGRRR
jgi:hypothetical protein